MSSVLPTSSTTFFRAYLRFHGWDDERIEDYIAINNLQSEPGLFVMLQGGAAGVAQLNAIQDLNGNPTVFKFGEERALENVLEIASVYGLNVGNIQELVP